jgi:RNA polymerase sigma-70 factor, ECF subfamily
MHDSLAMHGALSRATDDEDSLIQAAQQNALAFEPLYERYRDRIYWYLLTRTTDPEDAADLLQQVFLRAMDALAQYQAGKGLFVAWLFGIARNMATNFQRRRPPTVTWDALPEVFRDDRIQPEAEVLRREDLWRLNRLVSTLDPSKRELLVLRFVAGLTTPEIARVIGKSEAATKKQLSRTLQTLKEQYHDRDH